MKKIFSLIFVLTFSFASLICTAAQSSDLPKPKMEAYNRNNLFELINGAAGTYLDLGFRRLEYFTYKLLNDATINVFQYDMRNPLAAYSIFAYENDSSAEKVDFVKQGYVTNNADYYLRKGKTYIIVSVYNPNKDAAVKDIAKKIALLHVKKSEMENEDEGLEILDGVPKKYLVDASFEYKPRNALGLNFLKSAVLAKYKFEETQFSLLTAKKSADFDIEDGMKKYLEQIKNFGGTADQLNINDKTVYKCDDMGMFSYVFIDSDFLFILYDVKESETKKAEAFLKELKN